MRKEKDGMFFDWLDITLLSIIAGSVMLLSDIICFVEGHPSKAVAAINCKVHTWTKWEIEPSGWSGYRQFRRCQDCGYFELEAVKIK